MSAYILRTWGCQNKACQGVFESPERYPACPRCGCIRVAWVPAKVNVGKVAGSIDATVRDLCEHYGLSDINSPSPSRQPQAKILAKPASGAGGGVVGFNGFAAHIDPLAARTAANQSGAQCVPTVNRIDAKVTAGMDQPLGPGKLGLPALRTSRRGAA